MEIERRRKLRRSHFTILEVAQIWGVSANFVRRLIWDDKLTHTRFGRTIRVPAQAVEAYAKQQTVEGALV